MNANNLKYRTRLIVAARQPCPCQDKFREMTTVGFRLVNDPISPTCFLPQAINVPANTDGSKCAHWALSFFTSEISLKTHFEKIAARGVTIGVTYGTHVGSFDITPASGAACDPNQRGHFALHEYQDVEYVSNSLTDYDQVELEEDGDNAN